MGSASASQVHRTVTAQYSMASLLNVRKAFCSLGGGGYGVLMQASWAGSKHRDIVRFFFQLPEDHNPYESVPAVT